MGCRRPTLPRLPRRDRRQLAGARAPRVRERDRHAGGDSRARLQLLRDSSAARARLAAQAPRRHRRGRPRVLRQLRRRGQRGRVQARPPPRRGEGGRSRASADPRTHRCVPRTHDGHARTDRQAVHAGAVPADDARRRVHRLDDRGARGRARRPGRRTVRRADQGRGRGDRPARGLLAGSAGADASSMARC